MTSSAPFVNLLHYLLCPLDTRSDQFIRTWASLRSSEQIVSRLHVQAGKNRSHQSDDTFAAIIHRRHPSTSFAFDSLAGCVTLSVRSGVEVGNEKKDTPEEALSPNSADYVASAAKAALGAVPFAGSLLAELAGTVIPNQRIERIVKFAADLEKRFSGLEQALIRTQLTAKLPVARRVAHLSFFCLSGAVLAATLHRLGCPSPTAANLASTFCPSPS